MTIYSVFITNYGRTENRLVWQSSLVEDDRIVIKRQNEMGLHEDVADVVCPPRLGSRIDRLERHIKDIQYEVDVLKDAENWGEGWGE